MINSVRYNNKRNAFFDDLSKNENTNEIINKYFPITIVTKCNSFIRKILSITGLYTKVKMIAKKIIRM